MCIAIVKKPGGVITDEQLQQCHLSNSDGAGFAYVKGDGEVVVEKGFFDPQKMIEAVRAAEKIAEAEGSPMLIHFRISTGGKVDADNCHPFAYDHGAGIHNGWFFPATSDKSDTREFFEEAGPVFSKENVERNAKGLDTAFGGNKVAFLFKDKTFHIVNESSGQWHDGVWYSNSSWKPHVVLAAPGPETMARSSAAGTGRDV